MESPTDKSKNWKPARDKGTPKYPALVTPSWVALDLGIHPSTLWRWEKRGIFPAFSREPGRAPLIHRSTYEAWKAERFGLGHT